MEYSAIFHDMDKRFCYAIDKDLFVAVPIVLFLLPVIPQWILRII